MSTQHLTFRGLWTRNADLGAIVTVEEHSQRGGLGGAVAEIVAGYKPCPIKILGFPGFMPTGSAAYLFQRYGLTAQAIAEAAHAARCVAGVWPSSALSAQA